MAFFKEFSKQVSDIAQAVGKRTGEAAEVGRLNGRKQGLYQQIEELYSQIGKAYFATRDGDVHAQADALCGKVTTLQEEVDRLNRMIDTLRHQRRCQECGQVQPSSARFCANCGARLPEDPPQAKPEPAPAEQGEDQAESAGGDVAVEITWPEAEASQEAPPREEEAP